LLLQADQRTRLDEKRDAFLAAARSRKTLMGILNVTPDSFSDGGRFNTPERALAQAKKLVDDGADIVDIGAESTRPGHTPISAEEEWKRLEPLLELLLKNIDAPLSIDTYKAATARRATQLGVTVVNDVWGLQHDRAMADTVAEAGAGLVIMHNRHELDPLLDIVADLRRFFDRSLELAEHAGIPSERVILDPGIGFGKTKEQNLAALAATSELQDYGLPILIGISRKSIFGALLGATVDGRLIGTIAANLVTAMYGAKVFRVHDPAEHRAAFTVLDAIANA
jgi:dihydropteroate synthase